ncbi:AfsR/SARP family transcriptional regulator [Mycolicibacterium sp. ELW1]|uniref:AfsR/SARP family transcriptional regulator n=1 Tax=Mycobacteriaceae TaxID=1762 RepID=UPI002571007A|nr:BTAD domain-containing putative transcriptional regulator [Mycobacterium sp. ELW1]
MFRMLGEVDALVDGRRVDIGHIRQRSVLVCLLVDVNRPVSPDALIDRVWADAPPARARNALAAYVSRLRRALAVEVGQARITHGPGGYMLQADEQSVDLHRFRHQVRDARKTQNSVDAVMLFNDALDMWAGEPLSAIDTPWANQLRNSLAAERLSVILDRNDAALRAGRHAEILGELLETAQAHPLDERVAGQLMVAQYRSGRQDRALETYRLVRERLGNELGVDPSPALEAVYVQILHRDGGSPMTASPPPSVRHIPRRPTRLIGRAGVVRSTLTALDESALVTLTGVGGVGKTRLALAVAHEVVDRFADGVVVVDLAPLSDGTAVSRAICTALRFQPGADRSPDDALVEFLQRLRMLLVVDNCEHVLPHAAGLMDRITTHCPEVKVLATSRESLGIEAEWVVPVKPLNEEAATTLFVERARASRPDFDPERERAGAVADICRRLDGLPLAIELAAARMRAMSSADVVRRLDRLRLFSGRGNGAHPRHQSLTATIDWSYQLLTDQEQTLFATLAVFAGGFDLDAVHAVCAAHLMSEDDSVELLMGLVDKSMVEVDTGPGATRYRLLETLRAYGLERLADTGRLAEMRMRHAHYFTDLIAAAAAGVRGAQEAEWIARFVTEPARYTAPDYDNLRSAFETMVTVGDVDRALRLVVSLPEVMFMRIGVHSGEWAETVVEIADEDHPLYSAAVGTAARAAWFAGSYDRARQLVALVPQRSASADVSYCADPADILADIALYEGDPAAALEHYQRELIPARVGTDPHRLVWVLYNITVCHVALRDPGAGVAAGSEAMQVADRVANPTIRAMAHCALGRALTSSQPERAMTLFERARELAAGVGNNWLIGIACAEDAAIRAVHGDPVTAAGIFADLVDHWEFGSAGIGSYQWDTLADVARLLARLGAHAEAAALHRALVEAGREPPLGGPAAVQRELATVLSGHDAVELAKATLRRYV